MIVDPIYTDIADVAKHCDKSKLKIAEKNAYEYDLKELFCNEWDKIIEEENEDVDLWMSKIWALFSYARYVENSIYVDTASGFVRKDHSNSFPIPLSEIRTIAIQYRDMAMIEVERMRGSLCGKGWFGNCICDGRCENKNKARLFQREGKNLTRKGWDGYGMR